MVGVGRSSSTGIIDLFDVYELRVLTYKQRHSFKKQPWATIEACNDVLLST